MEITREFDIRYDEIQQNAKDLWSYMAYLEDVEQSRHLINKAKDLFTPLGVFGSFEVKLDFGGALPLEVKQVEELALAFGFGPHIENGRYIHRIPVFVLSHHAPVDILCMVTTAVLYRNSHNTEEPWNSNYHFYTEMVVNTENNSITVNLE
jgi:hypothetical protein